jgi:hypothetical protein
MRSKSPLPQALVVFAFVLAALGAPTLGQDFRVETDVFRDKDKHPVLRTLTLFQGEVVYDFVVGGDERITILDVGRGRFIFLDVSRKTKTTITRDQVLEYVSQVKGLVTPDHPLLYASMQPKFERSADDQDGWLTLTNPVLTYQVRGTTPPDRITVDRYRQFADWSAQLNLLLQGSLPPAARMELNRELADLGEVPVQVVRTTTSGAGLLGKTYVLRAKHLYNWSLSNTDHKRIERVGSYLATFSPISLLEYRRGDRLNMATRPPTEKN